MQKIFLIFMFLLCFHLLPMKGFTQNQLDNVIYIKEPVDRLVWTFTSKPKFNISKEGKKLQIIFYDVTPKSVDWIKKLPKEVFKEFNILYEKII